MAVCRMALVNDCSSEGPNPSSQIAALRLSLRFQVHLSLLPLPSSLSSLRPSGFDFISLLLPSLLSTLAGAAGSSPPSVAFLKPLLCFSKKQHRRKLWIHHSVLCPPALTFLTLSLRVSHLESDEQQQEKLKLDALLALGLLLCSRPSQASTPLSPQPVVFVHVNKKDQFRA